MELKDWIRSARKMAGLTQVKLGETLGVTKGNVSAWEKGRHEASYAQLQQIAKLAHIPLPGGEYKHALPSSDAPISAPKIRVIERTYEDLGDSISPDDPKSGYKNVLPALRDQRHIPIISYAQAGKMTEVVDPFSLGDGFETIQPTVECSKHSFALRLDGDSMEPRFHHGDVVIIDPERAPKPGNFVVAINGNEETTFKKYRPRAVDSHGVMMFELAPLNDDYPTLHSDRDNLRIIGVCVERREVMV